MEKPEMPCEEKEGKILAILPFLPCLLSKNSHFCVTASQNGGVNRNRQIGQNCAINCEIRGIYSNKNLIQSKNLFAVKSISNLVQRLARYRSVALISIGRLCSQDEFYGHTFVCKSAALLRPTQNFSILKQKSLKLAITLPNSAKL